MIALIGGLIAFTISFLSAPLLGRLLKRWGILARPGSRHPHKRPIPTAGGLSVIFGFFTAMVLVALIYPGTFQFVSEEFWGIDRNLLGLVLGGVAIAVVGVLDDRLALAPVPKLFLQVLAAVLIPLGGIYIYNIRNPFGVTIQFNDFAPLLTVVWVLLVTNTVNYLDGVDGLASGIGFIAALALAALAALPEVNQPATAVLSALLAGAIFGFLPYNFPSAKLFLGDTGAQFIGYMLAVFALVSGGKVATLALVLAIPILDVAWVSARRILAGSSPFKPDLLHLHHRLLATGLKPSGVLVVLWSAALGFAAVGVLTTTAGKFKAALAAVGLMIVLGSALIFWQRWRRIKESRDEH